MMSGPWISGPKRSVAPHRPWRSGVDWGDAVAARATESARAIARDLLMGLGVRQIGLGIGCGAVALHADPPHPVRLAAPDLQELPPEPLLMTRGLARDDRVVADVVAQVARGVAGHQLEGDTPRVLAVPVRCEALGVVIADDRAPALQVPSGRQHQRVLRGCSSHSTFTITQRPFHLARCR